MNVEDPIALLIEAHRVLREGGLKGAAYGGLALAAYGSPRFTKDTDLALIEAEIEPAIQALSEAFPNHFLSFDRKPFGGLSLSRVTVIDDQQRLNTIDLVVPLSDVYAKRTQGRHTSGTLRGCLIPVISPEDFVLFKVLSTREQDLIDASSVLEEMAKHINWELLEQERHFLSSQYSDFAIRWQKLMGMSGHG